MQCLRSRQQLTSEKLASLSNVPLFKLGHDESGKNEISMADLLKIACALKVQLRELID